MVQDVFVTKVVAVEQLTQHVWRFSFQKDTDFSFLPGQYIEITFPNVAPFPTREFTICSSPLDKNVFHIVTKAGDTPFKKQLLAIRVGDQLTMRGPLGGFVFDKEDKRERVYISGGLGITPFYSMMCYASQKNIAIPTTLVASFRKEKDFLFYNEIAQIAKKNQHIKILYSASESKGRISKEMLQQNIHSLATSLYYIAGPNQMVDDMQEILEKMHIPSAHVRVEYFNGYQSVE